MTDIDQYPVIPDPTTEYLNQRQKMDYRTVRESFIRWLDSRGKDVDKDVGYSESTVRLTAYLSDMFYRWVWDNRGYTTAVENDDADAYIRDIAGDNSMSTTYKAKVVKSLKRLFKYRHVEKGGNEWESKISFSDTRRDNPPDYLTESERTAIREAALEYGSIPSYNSVSPEERDRWKIYLAQRFEKPKSEVSVDDWERANGWKIPSLVMSSLDAGLRPIEVGRAVVRWVDVDNGVLRIPKDESSKNKNNWVVGLTDQTTRALDMWISERSNYPKYDDTDALWLTRQSNPYSSSSLRHVMDRLCDIASISTDDRSVTWYSIRHSVGTYMTREDGLSAAQSQLRHNSPRTTMRYDQTPVEDRKDALERMG
jgi:integrase